MILDALLYKGKKKNTRRLERVFVNHDFLEHSIIINMGRRIIASNMPIGVCLLYSYLLPLASNTSIISALSAFHFNGVPAWVYARPPTGTAASSA